MKLLTLEEVNTWPPLGPMAVDVEQIRATVAALAEAQAALNNINFWLDEWRVRENATPSTIAEAARQMGDTLHKRLAEARAEAECRHFRKDPDDPDGYLLCGHLEGTGLAQLLEELRARAEKAEAEVERLRASTTLFQESVVGLAVRAEKAEAEVERLRDACYAEACEREDAVKRAEKAEALLTKCVEALEAMYRHAAVSGVPPNECYAKARAALAAVKGEGK